jgi:hypothetical protein
MAVFKEKENKRDLEKESKYSLGEVGTNSLVER